MFAAGCVLAGCITLVAHDTFVLRHLGITYTHKKDPLKPVLGWRGLGAGVAEIAARIPAETVILTTRYQTASELAFYARNAHGTLPVVAYINDGSHRQNQYDYWPMPTLQGKLVLYVNEGGKLPAVVANAFAYCAPYSTLAARRHGVLLRQATVFLCSGFKGGERQKATTY